MPRVTAGQVELRVEVQREEGMYWAEVPTHPGLFASGATMDELIEALGRAWALYTSRGDSWVNAVAPAMRSLNVLVPAS
jgi:hypothetical protein